MFDRRLNRDLCRQWEGGEGVGVGAYFWLGASMTKKRFFHDFFRAPRLTSQPEWVTVISGSAAMSDL